MTTENDKFLVLTGKAYWAHVRIPNEMSGKYQLDLTVDSKTAKDLESKGILVKNRKTGKNVKTTDPEDKIGDFVTLIRGAENKKTGESLAPPLVVDSSKLVMDKNVLIGNGSLVKVKTNIFDWTFKGKKGKSLGLNVVQVLDLVKYENKLLEGLKEENGYKTEETTSSQDDDEIPF